MLDGVKRTLTQVERACPIRYLETTKHPVPFVIHYRNSLHDSEVSLSVELRSAAD